MSLQYKIIGRILDTANEFNITTNFLIHSQTIYTWIDAWNRLQKFVHAPLPPVGIYLAKTFHALFGYMLVLWSVCAINLGMEIYSVQKCITVKTGTACSCVRRNFAGRMKFFALAIWNREWNGFTNKIRFNCKTQNYWTHKVQRLGFIVSVKSNMRFFSRKNRSHLPKKIGFFSLWKYSCM